jgi:hypothetical protein
MLQLHTISRGNLQRKFDALYILGDITDSFLSFCCVYLEMVAGSLHARSLLCTNSGFLLFWNDSEYQGNLRVDRMIA